jgi:ubiquitin carboxyl-terminal hydrolase 4/11/15
VPDIFAIHLKRFASFRTFRDKIDDVVTFPIEGLDMSSWIGDKADNKHGEHIYDLFAVDNHFGGLGGGHYTAIAKNFVDGKWYNFDDSNVRETQAESAITGNAYLLFYRRRSAVPLGGPYMKSIVEQARARLNDPGARVVGGGSPSPSSSTESGQVLGNSNDVPIYQLPWASNPTELNLTPYSSDDETPNDISEINRDHDDGRSSYDGASNSRMSDDEIDAI